MTSTLASMRHLSVRSGTATFDVAVPLATRLGDLLESGGFPPGARLVDASGAPLPEDDLVGEAFEDGAIVYVVDTVHTPTLTRVGATAPPRAGGPARGGAPTRPGPARATETTPAPAGPVPAPDVRAAAQVQVDAAAAGARTRSATRRGRGRPGATGTAAPTPAPAGGPPASGRSAPPPSAAGADDPTAAGRHGTPDDGRPAPRRAVVPPAVRRPGGPTAGAATGGLLPPPPGPVRAPVPLPPGRAAGRGAHAAQDAPATGGRAAPGTDLAPRRGTGLGVPTPPRIAPPPTGATGRGAVTPVGGRRTTEPEPERRGPRGGPAEVALSPGAYAVPAVLAAATAFVVAVATLGDDLPVWSDWTAGAALLVAAVVAATRPGTDALQRWGRIAAAVCGGCGGFVLAVTLDVDLDVAAVCGLVVGSAVAMLGRASAVRAGVFEPWVTVTAVAIGAVAVDAALAIVLSWPAYVAPLLLAGMSPLIMRALPAAALDVPDEQLIDTERLSNTSWSARTGIKRRRRALRQATVELITLRASGIVAAGTVVIALFVTAGYGIAVASTMPGGVARWALLVEGVLLAGGIGLAGRTVRARFGKRVLRLTAAVVALETGYHLVAMTGPTGDVAVVVVLVAAALGVVAVSLALDVGWRSLRLSRLADFAEGFCVVFAFPAALLAVDVIAVLRQAVS